MPRILHILDHSLPAHSGYTFRTRAILKAQQEKGWDIAGVTGVRHPLPGPSEECVDGLTFHRTPGIVHLPTPLREIAEIGALAKRIDALVDAFRPDILHAHSPVLNALAAERVAKRRKIPLVYEIRAFWEDAAVGNGTEREGGLRYRLVRALERRAVDKADAVVVICEGLRADLIARGVVPDKITVSPNGVDLSLFGDPAPPDEALRSELGLADSETVGFIGSFYDYEGLDDLIAAMPELVSLRPKTKLLLVGGGPMETALRAQAAASPVADSIVFAGRVPHDRVEDYYGLIDILVYPRKKMRLTELVTPLKPLEAMAQGRLVAASDVGGHRELIEDGKTGMLFESGNQNAIAAAIAGLWDRQGVWQDIRRAARQFIEEDRDWSSNIYRYEPVYQKLLQRD